MIKNELFTLISVFDQIKNVASNPKFAYAIAKNRKLVQSEVDVIKEAIAPDEKVKEYDQKRIAMCRDYCQMDANGQPVIAEQNFVIDPEKQEDFNKAIEELREEYTEALDAHRVKLEQADQLLQEEVDLDFHKVLIDNFPDGLNQQQYELLMVFATD